MRILVLIDAAADPVSVGVVLAVVLFIIAAVVLIMAALVFFLWFRKRRLRHGEMVRPDNSPSFEPVQANQPNQP